jgi:hypothetical protein
MLKYAPCHKEVWGSGGIALHILNFGTETMPYPKAVGCQLPTVAVWV